MTETQGPLEYRPSFGATHYKPARTFDPARLALGVAAAGVGALAVGAAYGVIDFRVDSLHGKAFAISGAAVGTGLVTLAAIKVGRVRTRATATVLAALIGLVALYASWVAWPWAVLNRQGIAFNPLQLVASPTLHFDLVRAINAEGVWSYDRVPVRGVILLIVWIVEAVLIVLGAVVVAVTVSQDGVDRPYCERCRRWCVRQRGLPDLAAVDEERVAAEVEAKDFDALAARGPLLDDDEPHIWLKLFRCPKCGETNVLTVKRVALVVNEQGAYVARSTPLVEGLLLTAAEAERVLAMKARVDAMAAAKAGARADEPAVDV